MFYANVPNTVRLHDPITETPAQELPFKAYARQFWGDDQAQRWLKPMTRVTSLIRVLAEFDKEPGAQMCFEDADFEILLDIVKAPFVNQQSGGVQLPSPLIQVQLQAYTDAILNAGREKVA